MNGRAKHHTRQRTVVSLKLKSDAVTLGRNLSVAPRVTQSARLSPHRGWRTVPSPCHPPHTPSHTPCTHCPLVSSLSLPRGLCTCVPTPWCLHDLPSCVLLARCHTVIEVSHNHWIQESAWGSSGASMPLF